MLADDVLWLLLGADGGAPPNVAPDITAASITGGTAAGTTHGLSVTVTGTPTPLLSYAWKLDGVTVGTDATYTSPSNSSATLTCVITATNIAGSDQFTTAGVVLVPASSYSPNWVDNNGTGWLSYDGSAFGTDSQYLDMAFLVRSLNTNPGAACRIIQTRSARCDIRFNAAGDLVVVLRNVDGLATLVDWISDAPQDASGEWLFRIKADLGATPTFSVTKCQLTAGVPGTFSAVAGTFDIGPATGTLDNSVGGSGVDLAVFATTAGLNIPSCELACLWWSHSAPIADAEFADDGVLFDPEEIGAPVILITGPVADLDTSKGSAALTMTVNGTWTNS